MSVAWVGLGVSAVSAIAGSSAAENAEDAQHEATQAGIANNNATQAESRRQFDIAQANQQPFLQAGTYGVNTLLAGLQPGGQFTEQFKFDPSQLTSDPGYDYLLKQGQNALDRRQAAAGSFYSGEGLKQAAQQNQDMANTHFSEVYGRQANQFQVDRQNALNPLQSLAGVGQTSANQQAAQGASYSAGLQGNTNSLNSLLTGQGNATGAAGIAQGNTLANGLNQGLSAWQRAQYLNSANNPVYGYNGGNVTGSETYGWKGAGGM